MDGTPTGSAAAPPCALTPAEATALLGRLVANLRTPVFMTNAEAMAYLGFGHTVWGEMKAAGELPKPRRVSAGTFRYHRDDLDRWAAGRPRATSRLPGAKA